MSQEEDASDERGPRCPNVQALFDRYRPGRKLASLARECGVSEDKLRRYRKYGPSGFTRMPEDEIITLYARVLGCDRWKVFGAFLLDLYPLVSASKLLALMMQMSPEDIAELIEHARAIVARGSAR